MLYELAFNFILFSVGIFILIKSGAYLVRSLVNIAHFLNVSEFTLSFILMAFATTLPEFGVGISAAFSGRPLISLDNVFGSNILNLSFILGLVALIAGRISIDEKDKIHKSWFNFFLGISPLILMADFELSRWEGVVLILFFGLHLAKIFHLRELINHRHHFWGDFISHFGNYGNVLSVKHFFKNIFIFIVAVISLLGSAYLVVKSAETLSMEIGAPSVLIALFIIAFGTSLPELIFGLRSALSRNGNLSLGNLFGASVLNSTWILGLTALISPIKISDITSFYISAAAMVLVLFLANLFLKTYNSINRREGILLIFIYLIFIFIQFTFGF